MLCFETAWVDNVNQEQDRQCTYNVTMRRVRKSLLPWKSNKYDIFLCVCVVCLHACSLTNPAFNAPPYFRLRPLWLFHLFDIIL